MELKFKKTHPGAFEPMYATAGAACFDLASVYGDHIEPGGETVFGTGLAFEIPQGHVMLVYSRSGHGFKNSVSLVNSVGVIDSDYRGNVAVKLCNNSDAPFVVEAGDRIAQAMVVPVIQCNFREVAELNGTERGVGGFGSTGNAMNTAKTDGVASVARFDSEAIALPTAGVFMHADSEGGCHD